MEPTTDQVFYRKEHTAYLLALEDSKDLYSIGKFLTEHMKMAGGYWSLNSLTCLKEELSSEKIRALVAWISSCQNPDGGFGGNNGHDSHITSTHYALLILLLFDELK
jgi:geranylgeranyl transferase type-2 subunit beta